MTMTGISEIPVVPFYTNRKAFMVAAPPLNTLADVNIAWWQSNSDQRVILHYARVPILFGAGFQPEDAFTLSVAELSTATDPQSSLQWVEHSGEAIGAGRDDLKDLELLMEVLGLQLLVQKSGGQSATGEALDSKKETSQLARIAEDLRDALQKVFQIMGTFAGRAVVADVEVNTEYTVIGMTNVEYTALLSARNTGNISQRTLLDEFKRRGLLSPRVDIDKEVSDTADEGMGDDGNE